MSDEKVFAHIHFERMPNPVKSRSDLNIISTDSLSDQAPLIALRGVQDFKPQFQGITWSTSPEPLGDIGLSVRKITAWGQESASNVGVYSGLKQVSLVCKKENLGIKSFNMRYQSHVDIALEHHGMEKYAQNIDIEHLYGSKSRSSMIDGISELWFADNADWFERFYLQENSQNIVREDTQKFIDFQNTCSIMVSEQRFRRVDK